MEWNMLNESKKLFPHWLDKSENSNFSKHLKILNNQQMDIRHKLKCVDWSRMLNKPLQIHKTQTEPHKWKMEFEVRFKRLKQVNIYKNPTIVNDEVVDNYNVIYGYYSDGVFYENHYTMVQTTDNTSLDLLEETHIESDVPKPYDYYTDEIEFSDGKYYYDLIGKKYYKYENHALLEVDEQYVPKISLVYSQSFIDNYSHFFRHTIHEDNVGEVNVKKFVYDKSNIIEGYLKTSDDVFEFYKNDNFDEGDLIDKVIGSIYHDKVSDNYYKFIDNNYMKLDSETIGNYFENNKKYKRIFDCVDVKDNGKYELTNSSEQLYYNITNDKYYVSKNDSFVKVNDEDIIWTDDIQNENLIDNKYYIFSESSSDIISSKIPLIETEDITPLISDDKYVLEVYTWDDYHFLKGYPEIDFIDYNNNNIIEDNERTYDNLNITIEEINGNDYLTFRVHQYGIKLVEIFKDSKPIHIADFLIEKLGFSDKRINTNFAHIYNYNDNQVYYPLKKDSDSLEEVKLDVDEYVWRLKLTDDDKIFDINGKWNYELKNKYDIKVTYYDSHYPNNSEYDKILMKSYVYEDSIFYHDVSLDMIGKLFNVHRYVFRQPLLETIEEKKEFYSKTYPPYCNTFSEDDYHYQQRLSEYINRYNKTYFPVLELWKYFHIDSELVNRKVIVAEQNYSYMRTLDAEEDKFINELGKNKLESFYLEDENLDKEVENGKRPKIKSIIPPEDYLNSRNGILVDNDGYYIRDSRNGTPIKNTYVYNVTVNNETGEKEYNIVYENASRTFQWYTSKYEDDVYKIQLTKLLKVVPSTKYQLRFCVKEYPINGLNLKIIYKNNKGDVREVVELTPERKDYDSIEEYNELVYSNYKEEWGIECEYICTDFLTLDTAQNVEISLESDSAFKISDVTLQRITINHFDSEYMKTTTDYNSCVYDLYADYTKIPSNIRYTDLNIFNKVLNRSLPLTKTGYFNFTLEDTDVGDDMELTTKTNIYYDNLLNVGMEAYDYKTIWTPDEDGIFSFTYTFNKYIKKGKYIIQLVPFVNHENDTINDFKIDIIMRVFNEDNTATDEIMTINDVSPYLENDGNGNYFKIPFENKSENSFKIKIYRNKHFQFKHFKLTRGFPLTMEELIA